MRKISIVYVLVFLSSTLLWAQSSYKVASGSEMTVSGTSSLHDWTSKVNTINASITLDQSKVKSLSAGSLVKNLKISIPVESIESPRGKTMDDKTYEALKYKDHPNIIFNLKVDKVTQVSGSNFTMEVSGDLTMAGVTKNISMTLTGTKSGDSFTFKGSKKLDMTEYNMEPPTAMFGTIKVGEEVTVDFNLKLSPAA